MATKKTTVADVFMTKRTKKEKEVMKAIKRYCMQISDNDMKEVHDNVVDFFELNQDDTYHDFDKFKKEIQKQKNLKLEKQTNPDNKDKHKNKHQFGH